MLELWVSEEKNLFSAKKAIRRIRYARVFNTGVS
jgi:hypothetical protein